MKKEVIGYYFELTDLLLKHAKMEPHEFVGGKMQLCFGKVKTIDEETGTMEEEKPDDIIEKMLNLNIAEIVSVEGNIAKAIFTNPIPEDIFNKYYNEKNVIYAGEE
jgi:hypothetical protein